MQILNWGVGATFFAVGLILALSKSAKGSAVVTFLLGLVGGGGGGVALGGAHGIASGNWNDADASRVGWLLLAVGVGTVGGLVTGIVVKILSKKNIDIGAVQPDVDPRNKIE